MSRKDYELIAKILRESDMSHKDKLNLAATFATNLAEGNPRFDRVRFMEAVIIRKSESMPDVLFDHRR